MWRVSDWRGELLEFPIAEDGGSELIPNIDDYTNLQVRHVSYDFSRYTWDLRLLDKGCLY